MRRFVPLLVGSLATLAACGQAPAPTASSQPAMATSATTAPAAPATLDAVSRPVFNQRAAELSLPLFWREDIDGDGTLDPEELSVLWGLGQTRPTDWIDAGAFTPRMLASYEAIVALPADGPPLDMLSDDERTRRELVRKELYAGRPTLLAFDASQAAPWEAKLVSRMAAAAAHVETIFAKQNGSYTHRALLPTTDPASRMLFWRNQGPWCQSPDLASNPDCNALASRPKRLVGLYPPQLQQQDDYCASLESQPNAPALRDPFHVVREREGELVAIPYHEAYRSDLEALARELEAAAAVLPPSEAAFGTYLRAAAKASRDNDWYQADEAWAAMSSESSAWYLRVGPDEVYFDPCGLKAGFHLSFARINKGSLRWREALDPFKQSMEERIAELAGPPYARREVSFKLPDFIDIVLNAGDSRGPFGATIGQSLPNWGPVANEGRGRTVAMMNVASDPDSERALAEQAASLMCARDMEYFSPKADALVMSTVLHEAAHNLGPAHEYEVSGKDDAAIFGGGLASTLEELKAQTAALDFTVFLVERSVISAEDAHRSHTGDLVWSFGKVALGMYDGQGFPEAYSQLSAIQLGMLLDKGAVRFDAQALAANGKDAGCFTIDHAVFGPATHAMLGEVARVKATGDRKKAESWVEAYVDGSDPELAKLHELIAERWNRAPRATLVYSLSQ